MTNTCELCGRAIETEAEQAMRACAGCAQQIGIIPMPPSRRPPAPCTRCNHRAFVRVIPREHTTRRTGDSNAQISTPMYLTYTPRARLGWLIKGAQEIEVENDGLGLLEAYVCRKCGAIEWYCADVETITAHPHLMAEDLDYEGKAPYR